MRLGLENSFNKYVELKFSAHLLIESDLDLYISTHLIP